MIAGIIAEYNPFHNGHKFHLEQTKKAKEIDGIVVAMSQEATQRGLFSSFDKWWRTKKALENGADLVIGLPYAVSAQSAEFFAGGAVNILSKAGIDCLSFGAEDANAKEIKAVSEVLAFPDKKFQETLKYNLKSGISFPLARQKTLSELYPGINASLLEEPNNILAIEYSKAILRQNLNITLYPIKRQGAGYYDTQAEFTSQSASGIRNALNHKLINLDSPVGVPYPSEELMNHFHSISEEQLFTSIMERLILSDQLSLAQIAGITPDMANRLLNLRGKVHSLEEIYLSLNTKEITYAAISRILLNILTGFNKNLLEVYHSSTYNPFIRILGFNQTGREILKQIQAPKVINLGKDLSALNTIQQEIMKKDLEVANLRSLYLGLEEYNQDYFKKPVII